MDDLEDRLLAAHAADNRRALVDLYEEAAGAAESELQESFFLTHAYVFALEMDHEKAPILKARLVKMGREE